VIKATVTAVGAAAAGGVIAELTRLTGFTAVVGTTRDGRIAPPVADSTPQGRDTITVRD